MSFLTPHPNPTLTDRPPPPECHPIHGCAKRTNRALSASLCLWSCGLHVSEMSEHTNTNNTKPTNYKYHKCYEQFAKQPTGGSFRKLC
ncbi:hypothetical protein EYF80_067072 [Liparis tanakae]|uniref:Uncharacterized protein n=1 Tax=Liparis tanakae TaxID=230148 RepID=A0A4Z2E360_9TELE|nr:hypothetical protein EYF80_067072 [Liparis tanakae]